MYCLVYVLSATLTIRLPRELKEKLRRFNVSWSKEIRGFLEERIKQLEALNTLKKVFERSEKRKVRVESVNLIREDRERR